MEEPASPEASSLQPGAIVGERWQLVEKLGAGGFGAVWRATHVTLAHAVAVKFLQVGEVTGRARARFEREARIAARLGESSRHITRVIDYGVFRDSIPYLCMELLQGETLSQRLRRDKKLALAETAEMIVQLCRALEVAHAAGVVHRDLKPSNIFLSRTDVEGEVLVKLLDFGIAKSTLEKDGDETTRKGTIVGTPMYMSPEQLLCKKLDARADLWGVAACVYRMVCGRSPFGQGGIAELGLRILRTDPAPPSTLAPELPTALDRWMEKALAKGPEERFQSARELAVALAVVAALDGQASPDGTRAPVLESSLEAGGEGEAGEERTQRARPARAGAPRRAPVLAVLLALAALGGTAVGFARSRAASSVEPSRAIALAPSPQGSPSSAPFVASAPSVVASEVGEASVAPPPSVALAPKPSSAPKTKTSASPDAIANEAKQSWGKKDEL